MVYLTVYLVLGLLFLLVGVVTLALGFAGAVVGAAGIANLALLIVAHPVRRGGDACRRTDTSCGAIVTCLPSFPRWHRGSPGSHPRARVT